MAPAPLAPDFSAFLRLLASHGVEYLLVGGYAVGYHGHVRATADLDVWVCRSEPNATRLVDALHAFGFDVPELTPKLFLVPDRVVRLGVPPVRIELLTSVSGVEFEACYAERERARWDDVEVPVISLARLLENKRASGRPKDLSDLDALG